MKALALRLTCATSHPILAETAFALKSDKVSMKVHQMQSFLLRKLAQAKELQRYRRWARDKAQCPTRPLSAPPPKPKAGPKWKRNLKLLSKPLLM
jgi:hypothetical protein